MFRITKKPKLPNPQNPFDSSALEAGITRALNDVIVGIRAKTSMGVDYEGKPFKPYAEMTKQYKMTKTGSVKVNLVDTGRMLKSMNSIIRRVNNSITGRIYFASPEVEKAVKNNEVRPFFGLSREAKQNVLQNIKQLLKLNKG